jgi:predicted DsbA family dithiol-disulfide isomerase
LEDLGKQIGLPFDFAKRKRLYNTFDAHRVIHWAAEMGRDKQDQLVQSLFQANFVDGLNIADHAVLADLATSIGFDRNDIIGRLKGDRDAELVRTAIAAGQKMGITGVPCFVFEKQYAVSGAQEVNVFIGALQELADMKRQAEEAGE